MVRRKQAPRRKLQWWEKLASPTKEQWAYANAFHRAEAKQRRRAGRHPPMKRKPAMTRAKVAKKRRGKTCLSLANVARRYPDMTKTVCFYPKQATLRSLINVTPHRTSKVRAWYK